VTSSEGSLSQSFDPSVPHEVATPSLQPIVRCRSQLIFGEIKGAMKHAKNDNVQIVLNKVGNSVVPKQE